MGTMILQLLSDLSPAVIAFCGVILGSAVSLWGIRMQFRNQRRMVREKELRELYVEALTKLPTWALPGPVSRAEMEDRVRLNSRLTLFGSLAVVEAMGDYTTMMEDDDHSRDLRPDLARASGKLHAAIGRDLERRGMKDWRSRNSRLRDMFESWFVKKAGEQTVTDLAYTWEEPDEVLDAEEGGG